MSVVSMTKDEVPLSATSEVGALLWNSEGDPTSQIIECLLNLPLIVKHACCLYKHTPIPGKLRQSITYNATQGPSTRAIV